MRLSELLPQPIRNIYQNYQQLNDTGITPERRVETIQKISKDCFRLLLILPIAGCTYALALASEKNPKISLILVPFFIASSAIYTAANMLLLAGGIGCISVNGLILSITNKCIWTAGAAIGFGLMAAFCSEKYENCNNSLENRLITPLSNKFAGVFI
jgi:hypothetical protein